jgi:hypothetical protein
LEEVDDRIGLERDMWLRWSLLPSHSNHTVIEINKIELRVQKSMLAFMVNQLSTNTKKKSNGKD